MECLLSFEINGIVRCMRCLPGGWLACTENSRLQPLTAGWKTRDNSGCGVRLFQMYDDDKNYETGTFALL